MLDSAALEFDANSVRRYKSCPEDRYVVVHDLSGTARSFHWATNHFEARDLPSGYGRVLIYTDHAYIAGKAMDRDPFKLIVRPDELACVRAQLRERTEARRGNRRRGAGAGADHTRVRQRAQIVTTRAACRFTRQ